jgi:hypothetical protein
LPDRFTTLVQGTKKPLQIGDYVDFNDELDYEDVVMEICASHNASKTGLDKNIFCILAMVTVDGSEVQDEDSVVLKLSSPIRKTVSFLFGIF